VALAKRKTQTERTELSDRLMRDAAIELIVAQGTVATTLKDVGERAGYSRGLAGYRFGSKDALFGFIVRSLGEDWLQKLTAVSRGKVGYAAISAATDEHYRFCADSPIHVRAFYSLWFESVAPGSELKSMIDHIHERRFQDVVGWIEAGWTGAADKHRHSVDAESIAGQFCASIIGIVYYWLANPHELAPIEKLHHDLKHTMRLLLAPQEQV
jgi:AcrR family transcriptional regulator